MRQSSKREIIKQGQLHPLGAAILVLFFAVFLKPSFARAVIYQGYSIAGALEKAQPTTESLVIFDIDGTLVKKGKRPTSIESWKATTITHLIETGMPSVDANNIVNYFVQARNGKVLFEPAEATTISQIYALQQNGVKVIALTSQPREVAIMTLYQLRNLGLDFSNSSLVLKAHTFANNPEIYFENGALFISNQNTKGPVLKTVFEVNKIAPDKVIFIDNELKNVVSVETSLDETSIAHDSIHYTPFDKPALNEGVCNLLN